VASVERLLDHLDNAMEDDFDDDDEFEQEEPLDEESQSEATELTPAAKRAVQLGFKPQKELQPNRWLPYNQHLDKEAAEWFATVKANLARCLAMRDIRPGFITWTTRLNKYFKVILSHWLTSSSRYMRFYNFHFPLEDHVTLVKLYFDFCMQPDLEPWLVNKSAAILVSLLRRRDLLTRQDLSLPWRPLYDLYERLLYSHHEPMGMLQLPP